jgi:hypothetical protein
MLADLLRRLQAVHDGHCDVHQDHVGPDLEGQADCLRAVAGMAGDLDPLVRRQDRFERLREHAVVVRDQNGVLLLESEGGLHCYLNVTCYGDFVKGEDAHGRIQKLLVTGDNRLKQGVDPAKARQSYEQALEAAREAGLEDAIRPLVEIRLADLERLARESPPPSPPEP